MKIGTDVPLGTEQKDKASMFLFDEAIGIGFRKRAKRPIRAPVDRAQPKKPLA